MCLCCACNNMSRHVRPFYSMHSLNCYVFLWLCPQQIINTVLIITAMVPISAKCLSYSIDGFKHHLRHYFLHLTCSQCHSEYSTVCEQSYRVLHTVLLHSLLIAMKTFEKSLLSHKFGNFPQNKRCLNPSIHSILNNPLYLDLYLLYLQLCEITTNKNSDSVVRQEQKDCLLLASSGFIKKFVFCRHLTTKTYCSPSSSENSSNTTASLEQIL